MTAIKQQPLFEIFPVGQKIIFTVFNNAVSSKFNVKYVAEVHIRDNKSIDIDSGSHLVATFKTTPNNAGVGIFDLRSLLESYVSSDNLGFVNSFGLASNYKNVAYSETTPHPIHVIDKYCPNTNSARWFRVKFTVEGASTATAAVQEIANSTQKTVPFLFFNGVLQRTDYLTQGIVNAAGSIVAGINYGYDLQKNLFYGGEEPMYGKSKFLTNAPTTQYADLDDYGTVAFLTFVPTSSDRVKFIKYNFFDSGGNSLGTANIEVKFSNGFYSNSQAFSSNKICYAGVFPANLRNHNTTFQGLVTAGTIQGGYYTFIMENHAGSQGQEYRININCPNEKGYESIRLCWLNQWGVWDYYTFKQKSVRSTTTNRTTYTQLGGTWNEDSYVINGFKGGQKNFRVNSTERISVNTDFVTESEAIWFEELINSQEVYIIKGFDATETAPYNTITNKYVEPVLITSSNYVRKTIANDKLMQYTFEMERNKTQQTQTS